MSTIEVRQPRLLHELLWEVLDDNNNPIGQVTPSQRTPPTITNDTRQTIKRTISGLQLNAHDVANVNPLRDRIRPVIVVDGVGYSMGIFVFWDYPKRRHAYPGPDLDASAVLMDQTVLVDQDTERSFAVAQGDNLGAAMANVLTMFDVYNRSVEGTQVVGGQGNLFWPAGTRGTKILADLGGLCGFLPLYFNNGGTAILRSVPNPDFTTPAFVDDGGHNVQANSIMVDDVPLEVPNRYIVIDSGATETPLVTVYDVPDSAPHSYANRGVRQRRTITAQGIGSVGAALNLAKRQATSDLAGFGQFAYNTPVDPRRDTFDVVRFLGVNYIERRWSWTATPSNDMVHEVVRLFL